MLIKRLFSFFYSLFPFIRLVEFTLKSISIVIMIISFFYCRRSQETSSAHVVPKRSINLVVEQSMGDPLISLSCKLVDPFISSLRFT